MNRNQNGMTFLEWLNAANYGYDQFKMIELLEAWRHGEDPVEYLIYNNKTSDYDYYEEV